MPEIKDRNWTQLECWDIFQFCNCDWWETSEVNSYIIYEVDVEWDKTYRYANVDTPDVSFSCDKLWDWMCFVKVWHIINWTNVVDYRNWVNRYNC